MFHIQSIYVVVRGLVHLKVEYPCRSRALSFLFSKLLIPLPSQVYADAGAWALAEERFASTALGERGTLAEALVRAYGVGGRPEVGARRLGELVKEGIEFPLTENTFLPLLNAFGKKGKWVGDKVGIWGLAH